MLDGERGKPNGADPSSARPRLDAYSPKNPPMPFAGPHNLAMRLIQKIVAESERFFGGSGMSENARIGDNPYERA